MSFPLLSESIASTHFPLIPPLQLAVDKKGSDSQWNVSGNHIHTSTNGTWKPPTMQSSEPLHLESMVILEDVCGATRWR